MAAARMSPVEGKGARATLASILLSVRPSDKRASGTPYSCSVTVRCAECLAFFLLSGYGMSAEHRSKTAGVFSKLWDEGHLSVSRATGGRVERYGRRVAMHWLIQPMAASEAIRDPMLSALGSGRVSWPHGRPRSPQGWPARSGQATCHRWPRTGSAAATCWPSVCRTMRGNARSCRWPMTRATCWGGPSSAWRCRHAAVICAW